MPQETVTIVLSFHDDATRSDRDSDIAYLHQYLAPLMSGQRIASIDATTLYKGQAISADLAWDYFITRRNETYQGWLLQHGDEAGRGIPGP